MARSVSVAIVGGGFGGVAATIALKREGLEDITVLERGNRLGGVWRANTYPGLACDVPSHLYSYSFAPNPDWSLRYSPRAEIQRYCEDVARRLDVDRHVRFDAEVTRASFDEPAGRWQIELADGEQLEADVLITACGQLQRPSIPDLPGLERFTGRMFHSAHWDHEHVLHGRRVAVIGSGASAIQFVPAIAPEVDQLTVFQRSAPWVIPKLDAEYSERTKRLYRRFPFLQRLWRQGWWHALESLVPLFTQRPPRLARPMKVFYRALAHTVRFVQLRGDPRLVAATTPSYAMGCKRLCVTSQWYPTLRRSNVELVTTPIRELVEDGVTDLDGRHHAADTIIFGTGFTATEFLAPMEVEGRDGGTLAQAWEHGAEAYLGMTVPRFPNMFLLYGPNTNHGTGSAIALLEQQAAYVAQAVRMLATGAAERLEVRQATHEAFQQELAGRLDESVWASCTSWYVNAEGRVTNNWPGSFKEYLERTERVDPADYETHVGAPAPATAGD